MKIIRNLAAALLILSLPVVGLLVFRSMQPFFELHFTQESEFETAITVMLDGETYEKFVFDEPMASGPTVVVVRNQDSSLPIGNIRFADLAWPPGRVIVEVSEEVLDIMPGGVERRSSEWINPPVY